MNDTDRKAKARERAAKWAKENPERCRENQARWRTKNAEKLREYNKQYRSKNHDHLETQRAARIQKIPNFHKEVHKARYANPEYAAKCCAYTKAWRKANKERHAETIKKWKLANPERARAIEIAGIQNRRSRKIAAGKLSADDIAAVKARKKCAGCGTRRGPMEVDHIVPLAKGGTNERRNLQLLCRPCNRSKSAKDPVEWAQENGRLI